MLIFQIRNEFYEIDDEIFNYFMMYNEDHSEERKNEFIEVHGTLVGKIGGKTVYDKDRRTYTVKEDGLPYYPISGIDDNENFPSGKNER